MLQFRFKERPARVYCFRKMCSSTHRGFEEVSLDKGVSLLGLVSPSWWESLNITVVTSESVNTRFGHNESELGILILAELLQMLSDLYSLFDEVVEIFWKVWSESLPLQDSEDFATSDALNLWDSVAISESNTNLGWHVSFLGELDDLINKVRGLNFHPAWWSLSVWQTSASNTLALGVHSSHFVFSSSI